MTMKVKRVMSERIDTPASRIHDVRELSLNSLIDHIDMLEQTASNNKTQIRCNVVLVHLNAIRSHLRMYLETLPPSYRKSHK